MFKFLLILASLLFVVYAQQQAAIAFARAQHGKRYTQGTKPILF
jgi:hypothetical protein